MHRTLSLEWDKLVLEVRQLEGLKDFLGPKKISQLLPAASSGPVVVLNAHDEGCDALILRSGDDGIIHIPLNLDPEKAQAMLDIFISADSRKSFDRHREPVDRGFHFPTRTAPDLDEMIKTVLGQLWGNVVKPVLERLKLLVGRFCLCILMSY